MTNSFELPFRWRARALPTTCSGSGMLICRCGGDICFCTNDGYVDCPGCPECDIWRNHCGDPDYEPAARQEGE